MGNWSNAEILIALLMLRNGLAGFYFCLGNDRVRRTRHNNSAYV